LYTEPSEKTDWIERPCLDSGIQPRRHCLVPSSCAAAAAGGGGGGREAGG
jgi:hypothetical protein